VEAVPAPLAPAEPASAPDAPGPARGRRPWRENIEAALMAVIMALFLKYFVVEAYRIPSGSMQPTLIGDAKANVKDRILVDRLTYLARAPRRWEVAVFRCPLDRSKSFVKRIAGVGPEELRILDGDVWQRSPGGTWSVARRPAAVMEEHWKKLDDEAPEQSHWIPQSLPGTSRWRPEGRRIEARGSGSAAFRGGRESVVDAYLDGYPEELVEYLPSFHHDSGSHAVGDLRVTGRILALEGTTSFAVVLREGRRTYRFELPGPAAPADARARIEVRPHQPLGADAAPDARPYRLPAGRPVRFAVENLDDRLALVVDGEELLAREIEPAEDQFSTATLALEGEGADLDELMAWRDIYYTTDDPAPVSIPAGSYYMLGDNTLDSGDSREWTYSVWRVPTPDGGIERVRGHNIRGENPRTVGHGDPDGPWIHLIDEWGEVHWLRRRDVSPADPEPAPFVPREMIQGKAVLVFWPLDPTRGIWRLKWVN